MTDTELLDFIQQAPNPRLGLVVDAWRECKGGVSLRGSIEWVATNYPNAGFQPYDFKDLKS